MKLKYDIIPHMFSNILPWNKYLKFSAKMPSTVWPRLVFVRNAETPFMEIEYFTIRVANVYNWQLQFNSICECHFGNFVFLYLPNWLFLFSNLYFLKMTSRRNPKIRILVLTFRCYAKYAVWFLEIHKNLAFMLVGHLVLWIASISWCIGCSNVAY